MRMLPRFLEKKIKTSHAFKGNDVSFFQDVIRLPNGKKSIREYLDHPGAVTIVPFLDKKTILLLRQHRYPVGKTIIELPAGKLDDKENPLSCAKRELLEETGYWPGKIRKINSFWPTPAFANEIIHIYAAWNLKRRQADTDEDEFLEVFPLPFSKALEWVRIGRIMDSKSVIAILAIKTFKLNPYQLN
ncbi:MAG: NUDIX hydrolase [Elusimicrobia bacterium]|nr:NUDIX hydrolase [Elusimicrobiota bacterium]